MNTLSNGSLHGEEAASPTVGITPGSIPEASSTQKGVSVRYARSARKNWYVLRASYGREVVAKDLLVELGVYAYVPQRYEMVLKDDKRKKVLKSLLPNLVFAYLSPEDADFCVKGPSRKYLDDNRQKTVALRVSESELSRRFSLSSIISYYFNHFEKDGADKNPPLVIPDHEMQSFIRATSTRSIHLKQVDLEKCRFLDDKMVEVIQGNYKGVTGRVARVAGQQCIVVSLANGKWNISTDYIPTSFLRIL